VITRAERGGAQVHVLRLAQAMRDEFDVSVATGEEGFLAESCRNIGIPVYIVHSLQREIRLVTDARALWELTRLINRLRPDLIHTHTFKAGFLGRLAGVLCGVPSMYTVHSWLFGTPALPRMWRILGAPIERIAARWCLRLIVVSGLGARLVEAHHIASPEKVSVIPNGIPDVGARADHRVKPLPVLTMVARFTEAKDHELLLRAFARLSQTSTLRLIGSGPLLDQCKELAMQLGIAARVEFLGEREEVAALLAASDIFVLATRFEMFSLSILEAMRAGLPVVASDVGGNSEAVVDGETGILVAPGDVEAMSAALRRLVEDADLRSRMGTAGRHRFSEHFLCAKQELTTREVYRQVLVECGAATDSEMMATVDQINEPSAQAA
jgi:glycosyltransferase involved in cell wall biosynthesis